MASMASCTWVNQPWVNLLHSTSDIRTSGLHASHCGVNEIIVGKILRNKYKLRFKIFN